MVLLAFSIVLILEALSMCSCIAGFAISSALALAAVGVSAFLRPLLALIDCERLSHQAIQLTLISLSRQDAEIGLRFQSRSVDIINTRHDADLGSTRVQLTTL